MIDVTLIHTHEETPDVKTFWFKPSQTLRYTAGQFIELYLPHDNADDRGQKRWFTLSSSPTDEEISITTKFAGERSSTFKRALWELKPGATLRAVEPMGDFVLTKDTEEPLVFVAGGLGVTPYHSIIKWLSDAGEKRSIEMILAFNKQEEVLFEDLFRQYVKNLTLVLSDPPTGWHGESGHLSGERILQFIDSAANKRIYVSGPEPMVETLEKDLLTAGVDKNNLVLDFFPGYRPI